MRTSARNRLPGVVRKLKIGDIVAQVDVAVGENEVTAVITSEAAEELALKEGDRVVVVIKATEVMVSKADGEGDR